MVKENKIMKKLTAKILIVCILALQIFMLVACDGTATEPAVTTPAATTPAATTPVVITPSGDDNTPTAPNEIKNIILIIGDGMGLDHIAAGQMMYQKSYDFTNWQFTTSNTDSVNSSGKVSGTTDSAAGGTALATGTLTQNYYLGKDYKGKDVRTILDLAKNKGKMTGIVTTDVLHGATPSAFSAHSTSRYDTEGIVASQINSGVNLLCGHIDANCTSQKSAIEAKGYAYSDTFVGVDATLDDEMAYWQLDLGGDIAVAMNAEVALKDATLKALTFLDRDEDGFALMIEQAHVDKFSHDKNIVGTTWAVNSLNDTVEAILAWLGDRTDTAIVITADHETGGLSVSAESYYSSKAQARVENAAGEKPYIYYKYSSNDHTSAKVGVFVYGIRADFSQFSYYGTAATIKNINVYDLLSDVLNKPAVYGERAA